MGDLFGYGDYQLQVIIAWDLFLAWFSAVTTGAPVFSKTCVPACNFLYCLNTFVKKGK